MHLYQVRPRKDKRGVDLISDVAACVADAINVLRLSGSLMFKRTGKLA
jgi:hypothetical protein